MKEFIPSSRGPHTLHALGFGPNARSSLAKKSIPPARGIGASPMKRTPSQSRNPLNLTFPPPHLPLTSPTRPRPPKTSRPLPVPLSSGKARCHSRPKILPFPGKPTPPWHRGFPDEANALPLPHLPQPPQPHLTSPSPTPTSPNPKPPAPSQSLSHRARPDATSLPKILPSPGKPTPRGIGASPMKRTPSHSTQPPFPLANLKPPLIGQGPMPQASQDHPLDRARPDATAGPRPPSLIGQVPMPPESRKPYGASLCAPCGRSHPCGREATHGPPAPPHPWAPGRLPMTALATSSSWRRTWKRWRRALRSARPWAKWKPRARAARPPGRR